LPAPPVAAAPAVTAVNDGAEIAAIFAAVNEYRKNNQ
jgi:hypothetical protein